MAKVTIAIPFHWMKDWEFFLIRCLKSIEVQTFRDYEIVLIKHSTMPVTSNRTIQSATGELIKVLYMDDYLAHEDSLTEIVENFKQEDTWLVTGCLHQKGKENPHSPHFPEWTNDISTGNNCIGSPSVLTFRRESTLLFDENLSWLLDADLYKRFYMKYGPPKILNTSNVVIGLGEHQTTHILSDQEKNGEYRYLLEKYK